MMVFQSEMKEGGSFDMNTLKVTASKICSGNFDLPVRFLLLEFKANGGHIPKMSTTLTLNRIIQKNEREWGFIDPKTKQGGRGKLVLKDFKKEMNYAFIDYLRGGVEINMILSIDFTSSNKPPNDPQSLHYIDSNPLWPPNQYQQAIRSVASILLEYDHDKIVPIYGFGGLPREPIDGGK